MKIGNRQLERVPLRENLTGQGLILTTLALMALGVVMVFSTAGVGGGSGLAWYERTHVRQAIFAAVAAVMLCVLWRVDYHRLTLRSGSKPGWARVVLSPAALLLILAMAASASVYIPGFGHEVGGDLRWIRYGPVGFQPSEVLKIALLIALAAFLGRDDVNVRRFRRVFVPALALTGMSVALVVTQDFGTGAIIGITAAVVLLAAGVCLVYLLGLAPLGAAAFYLFVVRVPHRWARFEAMLNPADTTNRATYQPWQSIIAIASGVEPAGLGGGVAKYGYLPENQTDFIFAIICNELGMLGAFLVIGLLLVWLFLAMRVAVRAPDRLGALLAGGLGFLIVFQSALHVAVNVGWAPPTGVSLPFVSAGGSSLLLMSVATAVIVSVSARRPGRCTAESRQLGST